MKKILIPFVAVTLLLNACKKDDDITPSNDPPIITVEQPTDDHFHVGETIIVKATATDKDEMHNFKVYLISVEHNDTLWSASTHGHGAKTLTLNKSYVVEEHEEEEHEDEEMFNLIFVAENEAGKTATKTLPLEIHFH